jgi:hypothetical protein
VNGTVLASVNVRSLKFDLKAPKGEILAAGTLGPVDQRMDTYELSGSLEVYNSANTRALFGLHTAFSPVSLEWETVDSLGNAYHFFIPALHITSGAPAAGSENSDVYLNLGFMAKRSSAINNIFQLCTFPAS